MSIKVRLYTVTPTGIGRPDYSVEVALGEIRPGATPKFNQQFLIFAYTPTDAVAHPYVIPWVLPLLAPAASAHPIDVITGVPLPYTVPVGYAATLIEQYQNFNQDVEELVFFDGTLIGSQGGIVAGPVVNIEQVIQYSTKLFDPLALSSHTFDWQIINRGGANMKGGFQIAVLIEAIGTPPFPKTKDTLCPFCKKLSNVDIHQSKIVCQKCGKTYIVWGPISKLVKHA